MSSKCADSCARNDWSLTAWLTVFNAGLSCSILTLVGILLYGAVAAQLRAQNHLYLHDQVDLVERELRSHRGAQALSEVMQDVIEDAPGKEYVKHYVRIMDARGRVLAESSAMEGVLPRALYRLPVRDGRAIDRTYRGAGGAVILSTMEWTPLGGKSGEQGVVQVAFDVTNVDAILVEYRRRIVLLLFHVFLLCVCGSILIARRATRPLREIASVVHGITVSGLEVQIQGEGWPREFTALAGSLNGMLYRLHDSFTRLYNCANNLTHKMRTPLTILRGEAEVALSRSRSVEELREVIVSSLEENARLCRLGDNIFFLANADMGKITVAQSCLDVRPEVEKVVDYYSPIAEEKGIEIRCEGDALLCVDASLFRKAVAALLSNAITYSGAGGSVVLTLHQGGESAGELRVSDSGCGIPAGEMEKVFDRFYRIYGTRHMDPHGTGLGLPMARAIMELHGGWINVESEPGEGTTVTLLFSGSAT